MPRIRFDPLPWQSEVILDKHRFKVVCAGRRSGKSVLSRMTVLDWATREGNEGLFYIVSPTYRQSKAIHWRDYIKEIPNDWIKRKNEVELSVTLKNGSIIELKGAENPDSLRGVKLRGLVVDEIASIRNWDWLWHEVLRPTLTDYVSPAIFISTPKGFNHFYDLFEMGQKKNNEYKSWKFTTYDNPRIQKGEVDQAKKELTEDTFAQEYLADFRKFTGLVYKEFDREVHVVESFDIPQGWELFRSFDFGSTNPTVCLWIAVDNDENWYVVDEYYQTGETIDTHAGAVNANNFSARVVQSFGDPSGAQWITEFQSKGVYITPALKETKTSLQNWVRLGIERVSERLKVIPGHKVPIIENGNRKGYPKLFVFNQCLNLINEFEQYRWKEKSETQSQDLNEPDVPEKAYDHALDALRYFAVSYRKPHREEELPQQWSEGAFRIGK